MSKLMVHYGETAASNEKDIAPIVILIVFKKAQKHLR